MKNTKERTHQIIGKENMKVGTEGYTVEESM